MISKGAVLPNLKQIITSDLETNTALNTILEDHIMHCSCISYYIFALALCD